MSLPWGCRSSDLGIQLVPAKELRGVKKSSPRSETRIVPRLDSCRPNHSNKEAVQFVVIPAFLPQDIIDT